MKPHDFEAQLNKVEPWVELLKQNIEQFLIKHYLRTVPFNGTENIELQKNGIDILVNSESGDWEAKIRSNQFYLKKILLETISVVENNNPGWLHTCQADAIAYCWFNESETNLMRKGYIILIKKLRKTPFYNKIYKYPEITTCSTRNGETWTTKFILVPRKNFPKGTLYEFNPTLDISNYRQSTIDQSFKEVSTDV